ncbi:hypothetical protein FKW77_010412 [Venturia effusa]|uniref:RWD domain-containing protein n=1 Tax=Venturia effusa TaxID=50376 RepID=A0A517L0K6_9PEZI|nr:hypothetical protein FKW77_010412 [Venturia effusa]
MENAIADEITSINSIYGDDTLLLVEQDPITCTLRLPSSVVLRLEFPKDYPDTPPSISGTETVGDSKGAGKSILNLSRNVLAKVYRPGEACVYDLLEDEDLKDYGEDQHVSEGDDSPEEATLTIQDDLGSGPPWALSATITEKKSVFIGRAARVTSVAEAKQYYNYLLSTDKKVAKASHNMTAWRIKGLNDTSFQDCDDDGETAAGGRMLHLMQLMDVWDVMVIVTRWYGGVHLGPDRFRLINTAARDALVQGGFAPAADAGGKKKSKK